MAAGGQAQPCGNCLTYISEGRANANLCWRQGWGKSQYRHLFASVIGARPGGVVAVIGRQDQQIVVAELGDDFGQASPMERPRAPAGAARQSFARDLDDEVPF